MSEWKVIIKPTTLSEQVGRWPFRKTVERAGFTFWVHDISSDGSLPGGLPRMFWGDAHTVTAARGLASRAILDAENERRRVEGLSQEYIVNGIDPFVIFEPPADSEPEAPDDVPEAAPAPNRDDLPPDSLIIRGSVRDCVDIADHQPTGMMLTLECYTFPDDTASILRLRDRERGYNNFDRALVEKIAGRIMGYQSDTARASIAIGVVERWLVGDL